MNFRDPPAHTRLREPVRAAFTPRAVSQLERDIQGIVDNALDGWDGDVVDSNDDFCHPIPALVIASIMGAAPEDRHRFQHWSDDLGRLVFALSPGRVKEEPIAQAAAEFVEFFAKLIDKERREPSSSVLSAIVNSDISDLETGARRRLHAASVRRARNHDDAPH